MKKIVINEELWDKRHLDEDYVNEELLSLYYKKEKEKEKEKLQILHKEVEKYCLNLLISYEMEEFIKKLPKSWIIPKLPLTETKLTKTEITKKTLELNILKNDGCIDAAIYLWEALRGNGDPLSKRERQRAETAIRTCLSQNNTININTIFCAISSAII